MILSPLHRNIITLFIGENMTSIPTNSSELTAAWFTSILKLPKNHQISSIKLQALGEKDSVSGSI
jgi:hypothetical protein